MNDTPNDFMPSQEELKNADEEVGILTLVQGEDADDNPMYAYAIIPPSKYQAFLDAQEAGEYDLATFGEIVRVGDTAEPPEDVVKEMHEQYGANPNFETDLLEKAQEIQSETDQKNRLKEKYNL